MKCPGSTAREDRWQRTDGRGQTTDDGWPKTDDRWQILHRNAMNQERDIELAEGYKLVEMDPPNGFVGKSIGEIDIRSRFGVQVILIRHPSHKAHENPGRSGAMPSPEYVIQNGDKLLVLGDTNDIEKIRSH